MEGEERTEEMQQFAIALGAIEVRERKSQPARLTTAGRGRDRDRGRGRARGRATGAALLPRPTRH